MKVGVLNENDGSERRVALVPEIVKKMARKEIGVVVERGAGERAGITDDQFTEAGATVGSAEDVYAADVVARVSLPSSDDIGKLKRDSVLIGFLAPLTSPDTARALASQGVTSFAMEAIPRTTRAQSADALSSQATVAGYRAALIAAEESGRFFPMLTTAAGTVRPAKVMVLGAGVAGLQAIATARRLGAIVSAYDVRAAVKEQIESLGASFVELDLEADAEGEGGYAKEMDEAAQRRQRELLGDEMAEMDAVITTALIPGRPAPLLVTADAIKKMKHGAVVVDLAGEAGGNCEVSEAGERKLVDGVTVIAPLNLPSTLPDHASQLYARNVQSLLELLVNEEGALELNFEDDIVAGACITRGGEIVHEGAKAAAGAGSSAGSAA